MAANVQMRARLAAAATHKVPQLASAHPQPTSSRPIPHPVPAPQLTGTHVQPTSSRPIPHPASSGGAGLAPQPGATPAPQPIQNTTQPFLTPPQQDAWTNYQNSYNQAVAALHAKLQTGVADTNLRLSQAQQAHNVSADQANQAMAARGLFESSIRDSDLNDIDAKLVATQNTLNNSLAALRTNTGATLNTDQANFYARQNYYNQLAAQNAMAQPPALPTPAPTPAPRPAPTQQQPKPPQPPQVARVTNQPTSSSPTPSSSRPVLQGTMPVGGVKW